MSLIAARHRLLQQTMSDGWGANPNYAGNHQSIGLVVTMDCESCPATRGYPHKHRSLVILPCVKEVEIPRTWSLPQEDLMTQRSPN